MACAIVLSLTSLGACGHNGQPSAKGPDDTAAVRDPAPGARPEERNRLLEASWKEVVVKVAKYPGGDPAAAVKLVKPKLRLFHAGAAATPEVEAAKQKAQEKKDAPPAEVIDLASEL